jgi:hypothetical protein
VVRQQAGLPALSISHKFFASRVLPALLASGAAVEIWEPAAGAGGPGGKEEWVLAKRGSPGNTRALEELMLSSSSADGAETEAEAAALLGTSVMMAVQAQGGKHGKPLVLGKLGGRNRRDSPCQATLTRILTHNRLISTPGRRGGGECIVPHPGGGGVGGHDGTQGPGGAGRAGREGGEKGGGREDGLALRDLMLTLPARIHIQVGAKECLVLCREEEAGAEGGKEEDYLDKSILDVMTR